MLPSQPRTITCYYGEDSVYEAFACLVERRCSSAGSESYNLKLCKPPIGCKFFFYGKRTRSSMVGSPGASTTLIYSPGSSSTPIYSPGASTTPIYSPGSSSTPIYSPGASQNAGGADMDERKITWVSWKKVLASHREAGLGVNSIFALNHALLFKWIWRFLVYPNALWVKVVKAIHDEGGGINASTRKVYPSSVWINVLKAIDSIKEHGIDLLACCDRRIGDGCSTKFWSDKWAENGILKDIFPRVYALELDKSITVAAKKVQGTGIDSLRRHPRGGVESVHWS
ncbi:hypothetical protein Tco_0768558 [Tanacetum coccineum]